MPKKEDREPLSKGLERIKAQRKQKSDTRKKKPEKVSNKKTTESKKTSNLKKDKSTDPKSECATMKKAARIKTGIAGRNWKR